MKLISSPTFTNSPPSPLPFSSFRGRKKKMKIVLLKINFLLISGFIAHYDCLRTVNMVLNVHRNHEAYWGRGEGGSGGGGRRRLYTYRYTVTTRMIPALRWAAMRANLMFQ